MQPSKGRWARRKERRAEKAASRSGPETEDVTKNTKTLTPPPVPEILQFLDVGLASVTRNLQPLAGDASGSDTAAGPRPPAYAAVFVVRAGQSPAFHCHIPQMVAVAAPGCPAGQGTRLVGLSGPCGQRLSACLGVPRVSCVGLRADAPGAAALVEYVRGNVTEVDIAWLREGAGGVFKATKIVAVETVVGAKRVKKAAS